MQDQPTPKDRRYLRWLLIGFVALLVLVVLIGLVTRPATPFT